MLRHAVQLLQRHMAAGWLLKGSPTDKCRSLLPLGEILCHCPWGIGGSGLDCKMATKVELVPGLWQAVVKGKGVGVVGGGMAAGVGSSGEGALHLGQRSEMCFAHSLLWPQDRHTPKTFSARHPSLLQRYGSLDCSLDSLAQNRVATP